MRVCVFFRGIYSGYSKNCRCLSRWNCSSHIRLKTAWISTNDFVSPYIISNLAASHSAVGNFRIILKQIFTKRFKHAIPKIFHYMLSRFFSSPSSLSCFCLSALFIISVSLPFPFSLLLRTDFPMCCRCGYAPIQEGIAEKTSLVTVVSLAMFLTNFYNWRFWSHEWKMTILRLRPRGNRLVRAVR